MAGVVDVKILRAPARDVVKRAGGFDAPRRRGVVRVAHLNGSNERTIKRRAQKATRGMKIFRDASVVVSALRADFEPQARRYKLKRHLRALQVVENLFSLRHAASSA